MFLKVLALSNFKNLKIVIKFFHSSQGKIPLQNIKRLKNRKQLRSLAIFWLFLKKSSTVLIFNSSFKAKVSSIHCPKGNPNFRDVTWNVAVKTWYYAEYFM